MVTMGLPSQSGILNSWKEIASYLGRGVRTVQRWEKIGLPVRRLHSGRRAPVIAAADDLDNWLLAARRNGHNTPQPPQQLLIRGDLSHTLQRARLLREELKATREGERLALHQLTSSIAALRIYCSMQSHEDPANAAFVLQRERDFTLNPRSNGRKPNFLKGSQKSA